MTRRRNAQSRLLRATGLLVSLAGITVSTAGPAGATPAEDAPGVQAEPAAAQTMTTPTSTSPTTTAPVTTAPTTWTATDTKPGYRANSVSLIRNGGGRGQLSISIQGSGSGHLGKIYRLASSPEFLALRPAYVPASKSGKARYELEVGYRNGREKKVVTYTNTPAPRVLTDMIRLLEHMPPPKFPAGFPFSGGNPFAKGFPFGDREF
ncbi:hypothetical protein [Actinoplanes flavus]|uniref:Uncharacterized protein n=1 Tax=Actinoplanes flavus TaxID=2820290 RepID=A0ABS3UQ83_9ACTN|nr:hypothetical protein [Actinoplanes flavus]MBO3740935.1 hypothetical protein [Actinoplanes flavus]